MSIGEFIRRTPPKPAPESTDLLNGPHKLCECGSPPDVCCSPLVEPRAL